MGHPEGVGGVEDEELTFEVSPMAGGGVSWMGCKGVSWQTQRALWIGGVNVRFSLMLGGGRGVLWPPERLCGTAG